MMNFLNISNLAKVNNNNIFTPKEKQIPTENLISKLADIMPSYSFKALTSQITALTELDEQNPVGKNLNIAA